MIEGGGIDREELARLTEKIQDLTDMAKRLGSVAREGIAALDEYVVTEHPDLGDLGDEMRNVYGSAFEDPPA